MNVKIDISEALRYLGVKGKIGEDLREKAEGIADMLERQVKPSFIYRIYEMKTVEEGIALKNSSILLRGENAREMLATSERAIVFCCTIGEGFERLLRREQARDMSRAVILDTCGSAYVEAGCDGVEAEIKARFPEYYLTDRFSPGYGDLPLETQTGIFQSLEITRRLGVHLTDTKLCVPSKTVTAIIGLSREKQRSRIRGCTYCMCRDNCQFSHRGCYL